VKFLVTFLFLIALQLNVFSQETNYQIDEEIWMVIKLKDKRIGFSHEIVSKGETSSGEKWKTESHQKFKIQRLDSDVEIESRSVVIEDTEGVVLDFETHANGSGTNIKVRGYRENDFIKP
jgi:hypothetical protein